MPRKAWGLYGPNRYSINGYAVWNIIMYKCFIFMCIFDNDTGGAPSSKTPVNFKALSETVTLASVTARSSLV